MKAAAILREGTPVASNIDVVDWDTLEPHSHEVLVKTEASSLNHLDLWVGIGMPGLNLKYPRISGSDGCGIVKAVGSEVDSGIVGKRVLLNAAVKQNNHQSFIPDDIRMIGEHDNGANAEYFTAPRENVIEVGDIDAVTASAFGLTHLTAWRMLVTKANLQRGQTVLITGIGGGVALAALNICNYFNCTTIVTSRHKWKLEKSKELGATHCVLDKGEDWSRSVRSLTDKQGANICVDSIGGPVHHPCIKSLARGGVLVTCGCTAGAGPKTDLARIFWNQLSVVGSTMGDMEEFADVLELLRDGVMPTIDSVFSYTESQDAFARLESGEQFGKIVIDWSSLH
tara:strand:- start:360 stop:1382 length:1023 start_codon:yes stop_codon:yes gene_type:complete